MRSGQLSNIGRNFVAIVGMTNMCDIGRHLSDREIVHSLIRADMGRNFDLHCFNVVPENAVHCMWHTSKEDAFARVGAKLGSVMPWRTNPDTTAKGPDVGEVFLFTGCKCNWGLRLRQFWWGV